MRKQTTLGGDTVRLTSSKFITLAISMLTTMLLSRFRTYTEYGTYSQLILVINLFTSLLMLGLPNSINYFLARAETQNERKHFLSVYYTLSTVLSFLIGLVLVLAIPLIESYFHNPLIRGFSYFLGLYPWSNIISSSIENLLVVYKKTRFLMLYRIIYSAVMLGTVVIIQWLGFGFTTYMVFFVSINCIFALTVYLIASRLCGGVRFLLDKSTIRAVFTFSIPMGLATVIGTLNTEIDKLLIGYLMDTEQLAIYTNAAKELPLTIVASSVTAVMLPQMTRMIKHKKGKDAIRLWGDSIELSFIIIALIVAGVIVFSRETMTILYSEKYLPGINVFRIYTLNLLLRCTYFGIILNAYGETKKIFWCSVLSLGLNVVLNPLCYWFWGMIGPAIATFVSIMTIQIMQLIMSAKITGIPLARIFPWRMLGIILLINGAFGVFFWIIKRFLPLELYFGEVFESIVIGIVWVILYFAIMRKRIISSWRKINSP